MHATTLARSIPFALLAGAALAAPVPKADDLPPVNEKDMSVSAGRLKQIGLAIINCADTDNGTIPSNFADKDGKPLLSWRVAILPYIEETPLYKQFKLDEPWDSENNKKLVEKMPKLYAPVRVKAAAGMTFYQTFSGKGTLFSGKTSKYPASIPDGTSNTGLVFEAGEPVIWTKPADLPFDAKKPLPKLGGMFDGICNVVMCDGEVKRLKKDADEDNLKRMITPADGDIVDFEKLEK
jgi:hypothetical protein